MATPERRRRLQAWLLAAITVVGLVIRLSGPGTLRLDQFDEGIYALGGLWALSENGIAALDPMLIPYAPPIFPILVGLADRVLGVNDLASIAPSLLAGVMTIAIVGWIGGRTFGPAGGLAAASLAAFSGAHSEFSRMALTDATFLLAWLLALLCGQLLLERPTLGRGLLLGLTAGLAWNTKYNGWLAGVVVLATAVWGVLRFPEARVPRHAARVFGFGAMAAILAVGCYLPWALFVERNGGYAALMAHQRSYLNGPTVWLPHLRMQLAQAVALSGPGWRGMFGWCFTWAVAAWAVGWRKDRTKVPAPRIALLFAPFLLGLAATWFASDFIWWAALLLLPRALGDSRVSVRLVAMSWLITSILTPFYHPYARLWLPVHAAGWLMLGGAVGDFVGEYLADTEARSSPTWKHPGWAVGLACVLAIVHWQASAAMPRPLAVPAIEGRGLAALPRLVHDRLGGDRLGVAVLARPPALFYLGSAGILPRRLGGLADIPAARRQPGLILVDEAVLNTQELADFLRDFGPSADILLEDPLRPVTSLDVDPSLAFRSKPRPAARVFVLDSRRIVATP